MKPRKNSLFQAASAAIIVLTIQSAFAGQIWDGGGGDANWNTPANWDSDALPDFATAITFAGNIQRTNNNNLTADTVIGGINFTNTTTTEIFTLGGNRITLGGNITTTAAAATMTDTIDLAMILNGNRTITPNTNHHLTINGIISDDGSNRTLTKLGAGTLILNGENSFTGGSALGTGTASQGIVGIGHDKALGTGAITLKGSQIQAIGGTRILANNIIIDQGAFRFSGSNDLTINGSVLVKTPNIRSIQNSTTNKTLTLNGNITLEDSTSGISIDGVAGTVNGTTVLAGNISGGAPIANIALQTNTAFVGGLAILSGANTFVGRINHQTGTLLIDGTGTLGNTAPGVGSYAAAIAIGTASLAATFEHASSATQTLSGNITGTNGTLTKSGSGTLTLSGTNTYGGNTNVYAGTLLTTKAASLANYTTSGEVVFGGGTLGVRIGTGAWTTAEVNTLLTNATKTSGALGIDGSLSQWTPFTTTNFGPALGLKLLNGDFILNANNTYAGGTTINGGRLFIEASNALPTTGAVQVNNGGRLVLNTAASPTFSQSITLASGATLAMRQTATVTNLTLPTAGIVNFNRDNATTVGFTLDSDVALTGGLTIEVGGGGVAATAPVTLAGDFSGSGFGLTKTQPGTLVLSGTNTYDGATTVSAGTLFVTGSLTSDVTVSDNATVGGGGTVGAASFAGGSFFDIALAIGGNALDSSGTISFSSAGFGIDNLRYNGAAVDWSTILDDTYTLINGNLNEALLDNFGVANAFDIDGISGSRVAYFAEGSLNLVVIPEPRAALLGGLGLLALLRRRRC
jgi:autotransporter-associated beta strand protein